jgi:hypothetical protein
LLGLQVLLSPASWFLDPAFRSVEATWLLVTLAAGMATLALQGRNLSIVPVALLWATLLPTASLPWRPACWRDCSSFVFSP